ncbi:MAG: aspartate kinase, partial [Planctomycetes bacterium]|nr:aspartate kinase [Planctomycetota bacterium]
MIGMKFGGTSVGTAETIRTACGLVKKFIDKKPVVIVSAHNSPTCRMTNTLIASAEEALSGKPDSSKVFELQRGVCKDLGISSDIVEPLLEEYDRLLVGISMIQELSPRTMDLVMSFGERMSSRVFTAVFNKEFGVNAKHADSYDLGLITTPAFGEAQPLNECYPEIKKKVEELGGDCVITTGFIGKGPHGHITTLGRGGSDYSATIFGAAVDAEEVQIWTDVSGVMTADPKLVDGAKSIPELSFMEASELAWYGAKVLHPATMIPAIEHNIPVRVMNTHEPDHPGTVIRSQLEREKAVAKSVAYKKHTNLVTVTSSRMLGSHGFMAKVFEIFNRHKLDIHMIATSEVSISLTIPEGSNLEAATAELKVFGDVDVSSDKALVCLIGEGMAGIKGVARRVCGALSDAGVNIRMISQGARELNISLLVDEKDAAAAVQSLH